MALSRLLLDRIDGELTGEQERQIGYIRRSAENLLELVNDLLDLSKVEAGKVEVKPTRFMVSALLGALRGALRPLLSSSSVELFFDAGEDLPEMLTDEAKVAQILRNLISNALKFTEKGEVRVTARYEPEKQLLVFKVRDTGIGIAAKDLERIHWPRLAAVPFPIRIDWWDYSCRKRARAGLSFHVDGSGPLRNRGGGSHYCRSFPKACADY